MSFIKFDFKNNYPIIHLPDKMLEESIQENIGKIPEDFTPLQQLGEGGFGTVLKVKSQKNNKIYVMKIINKEKMKEYIKDENIDIDKYSKKEIIILKKLNHPNIVKYYDSNVDEKNYYIIIEYINGVDLSQFLNNEIKNKNLIEERIIWDFLGQCLEALVYIHGKGVIHRDLKFLNILIEEKTKKLKIIDFNASAVMDHAAAQYFVDNKNQKDISNLINEGTGLNDAFQAPEVKDNYIYDAKIDVFAIGKIFEIIINYDRNNNPFSNELLDLIQKMIIPYKDSRPTSNEIYDLYKKYYSFKSVKYSSIFSCLHCLFNYPIWGKNLKYLMEFKNKEISKYFIQSLILFFNNKQNFEVYINEFKINKLQIIYENNDKCEEIDPINFIKYIFAELNKELNTIPPNNIIYKNVKADTLKYEKYFNYTRRYKLKISSIISNNFFGILELKKECTKCKSIDYIFNYFSFLSFNVETLTDKNITLNPDNLFYNLKEDFTRNIRCNNTNCKDGTKHKENIRLFKVPKNFIIFFDRKKKNSKETIKTKIDFPEILILGKKYIEIFLSGKNPEIKFYLSSVLCQVDDGDGNEYYVSFTRDFTRNQNINNNNYNYYNFSQIKDNYNIIGLFYLSEEIEIINNYREGQQIYKLNISKQNINNYNILQYNNINNIYMAENQNNNFLNNNINRNVGFITDISNNNNFINQNYYLFQNYNNNSNDNRINIENKRYNFNNPIINNCNHIDNNIINTNNIMNNSNNMNNLNNNMNNSNNMNNLNNNMNNSNNNNINNSNNNNINNSNNNINNSNNNINNSNNNIIYNPNNIIYNSNNNNNINNSNNNINNSNNNIEINSNNNMNNLNNNINNSNIDNTMNNLNNQNNINYSNNNIMTNPNIINNDANYILNNQNNIMNNQRNIMNYENNNMNKQNNIKNNQNNILNNQNIIMNNQNNIINEIGNNIGINNSYNNNKFKQLFNADENFFINRVNYEGSTGGGINNIQFNCQNLNNPNFYYNNQTTNSISNNEINTNLSNNSK